MILDNIVDEINKAKDIVILTHETPDGDAIGSSLALYGALKSMGKTVDVVVKEVIAGNWGNGEIRKNRLIGAGYDYDIIQKEANKALS